MNEDYIMRMIEQFFRALSQIVRQRIAGDHEKAFDQIQIASRFYLETEFTELLKYTPEELLAHFTKKTDGFDTDKGIICGELLHEMALISKAKQSDDVALRLTMFSLFLYTTAIPKDKQLQKPRYFEKVSSLIQEIQGYKLPLVIQSNLQSYQEFMKRFHL